EVTPLSDAYGTGTVLWSLIEGRAFRSGMSEAETYDMAARGEYPPLRRAGIPEVLRRACEGLLHPNPQERMTLAQLHRELERSFGRKRSELMRFIESTAGSEGWRSGMTGIHAQASSRAETPSAEGRATPSSVIGPHGTYDVPESGTSSEILHINTSSPTVRRIASES